MKLSRTRRKVKVYGTNGQYRETITRNIYKSVGVNEYIKYRKRYYKLDYAFNNYVIWV